MLRWAPLAAAGSLPFTFAQGPISAAFFVGAVLIAATWLLALLFSWRTRNQLLSGLGGTIVYLGPNLVGINSYDASRSQFFQWLCYVVILTGMPLLIFRVRLFHFARLDESNVA